MSTSKTPISGRKVPSSKVSRVSVFGSLAARVVGNMIVEGAKEISKGKRPASKDLLLTTSNIEQVTKKLAHLRGAAMKLGQMVSMDGGELLSPELSAILSRLRSDAAPMPHKQLIALLQANWGDNWLDSFSHFDLRPYAAASIGQVHIANLANGNKLAVKLQYPGVKDSIASDVDNVATLLNMSGLLPKEMDISSLLEEAKVQLQNEADYRLEASYIEQYQNHLTDAYFQLPQVYSELSNDNILVMNFIGGQALEHAVSLPQNERNHIISQLIKLFLAELFDFKLMQTDPNFANFLYDPNSKKIGLLDFGATRNINPSISQGYKKLINAGVKQPSDTTEMVDAARQIGFFKQDIEQNYLNDVLSIFDIACEPLHFDGEYDFAASKLATRIREKGMAIQRQSSQWHTPPVDALFIHRKLGGIYLMATKLKAKVNVKQLFTPYLINT